MDEPQQTELQPETVVQEEQPQAAQEEQQAQSTQPAQPQRVSLPRRLWLFLSGPPARQEYTLTRWLFLRGMGFVYLFAFASLAVQALGLFGSRGILPAGDYLKSVGAAYSDHFWLLPTLAWFNSSDGFLLFLCWGGVALSLLLIAGVLPGPMLALLWAFYLSLVGVGQEFMAYQWDILLLEAGLLAIFFAPAQLWWGVPREAPPSHIVLWLLRLLLFRLMFFSGYVKLASGDPTWHGLTALGYHYWTQPLPTPLAWFMEQLPAGFQQASTVYTFVVELGAPFLIFGPRRLRLIGAGLLVSLQALIMLTGNFAFFNILSMVLCLSLLDDQAVRRFVPGWVRARVAEPARPRQLWLLPRRLVVVPLAILVLALSYVDVTTRLFRNADVPDPLVTLTNKAAPFYVVNSYGLFAVMTTSRPEIVVEGSNDGQHWVEYEFKYKAGDVNRMPSWVAPHQPRLDWQMWFAALSGPDYSPLHPDWFDNFMRRLLEGSPDVLALLDNNPFPNAPPKFVRALEYNYTYTHFGEGGWWHRELTGLYYFPTSITQP